MISVDHMSVHVTRGNINSIMAVIEHHPFISEVIYVRLLGEVGL